MAKVIDLENAGAAFFSMGSILQGNIHDYVRLIALAIDTEIVLLTPVDTGRARANWLVNVGSALRVAIEPYRAYSKGARPHGVRFGERINANGAFRQANTALAGYSGQPLIVISNNVDYIEVLDSGIGSTQAPAGMTGPGINAGIRSAARAARKILERGL